MRFEKIFQTASGSKKLNRHVAFNCIRFEHNMLKNVVLRDYN